MNLGDNMILKSIKEKSNNEKLEESFRRIILRKSWNEAIVELINNHLFENKSCGGELPHYNPHTERTYAGVPLIQDSSNNMPSTVRYGEVVTREHHSSHITFTGEVPVATEITCKDYAILFHEIITGELNLKHIIAKYEESWAILDWVFARPMQKDEFPVVIWGWSEEIEMALTLLSWKEAKLIEIGRIKLVPLEVLVEEAPEYFDTEEEKGTSLFSFI